MQDTRDPRITDFIYGALNAGFSVELDYKMGYVYHAVKDKIRIEIPASIEGQQAKIKYRREVYFSLSASEFTWHRVSLANGSLFYGKQYICKLK